jgi:hypothetical protein
VNRVLVVAITIVIEIIPITIEVDYHINIRIIPSAIIIISWQIILFQWLIGFLAIPIVIIFNPYIRSCTVFIYTVGHFVAAFAFAVGGAGGAGRSGAGGRGAGTASF